MFRKSFTIATLLIIGAVSIVSQVPSTATNSGSTLSQNPTFSGKSSGVGTTSAFVQTTIITPTAAGFYRLSIDSVLTTAGTGGTFQGCMGFTSFTHTGSWCGGSQNLNGAPGLHSPTTISIWCDANQAIQFIINIAAPTGSPVVSYAWTLEQLQ